MTFTSLVACALSRCSSPSRRRCAPPRRSGRRDQGRRARVAPGPAGESRTARSAGGRPQLAFSLVLLAGAALFLRSLGGLLALGFRRRRASNLLIVRTEPRPGADREPFYRRADRSPALAAPGVTAVSLLVGAADQRRTWAGGRSRSASTARRRRMRWRTAAPTRPTSTPSRRVTSRRSAPRSTPAATSAWADYAHRPARRRRQRVAGAEILPGTESDRASHHDRSGGGTQVISEIVGVVRDARDTSACRS